MNHIYSKFKHLHKKPHPFLSVIVIIALMAMLFPAPTLAGSLTASRDRMNRMVQSQTTGISHTVAFTTSAVNGTENKVALVFHDDDDGLWCRTAGSDITVAGSTDDSATSLPGTLTAACTQGAGASSYDTITISGVSDLSTSTRYGFVVSDGSTGKLGTPTTATTGAITVKTMTAASATIDSQVIAVDIIANDQVAVSGTVDPTITVSLSANTAALSTLSASQVNQAGVDVTVSTNATNGYTSYALYNNTLTSGANTIADTSGGTIVAGTEEFGASSSDSGNTIAQWSPAACTNTATTSNATALTTSAQAFASNTAAVSGEATTLCLLASITALTEAGTYTSTVTVVTVAKY